jgi:hypothetical protein
LAISASAEEVSLHLIKKSFISEFVSANLSAISWLGDIAIKETP